LLLVQLSNKNSIDVSRWRRANQIISGKTFQSGVIAMNKSTVLKSVAGVGSLVGAGAASAEVPAAVTTALASIQADAITVATVVLVAIVAIFAFKFLRKGL
jgi:hypothetical protein